MALFDSAMQAAVKAVSDSSSEGYQSPYEDSYYYNPTGGTDADFLAYLKRLQAERKGGILGGGMFGRMGEAEKKDVNANDVLGDLINKRTSSGYDPNQGGSDSDAYAAMQAAQAKGMTLEDLVRAKSGQDFDPLQLMSLFGPIGSIGAGIGGWARNSAITKELESLGYSKEQIDYMLDNSDALMSELGTNPDAGFTKDINYEALRNGGGFSNQLLGLFGGSSQDEMPTGLNPFAMGRIGEGSNVATMNPASTVGTLNDGRLFSTVDPKAAAGAEAAAERIRVAAAAAEAARLSEAQRQARLESTTSRVSGGGTDGSSIGWSSPSDSVNAGRTSSSDISYSASRDRSSTTGYDFNKD